MAAEDILFQSLGIPRIDLSTFDPIDIGLNPNATAQEQSTALKLQAVTAQISNLLLVPSALIDSDTGALNGMQSMTDSLLEALIIAAQNNHIVDLTDQQTLKDIMKSAAAKSGIINDVDIPVGQIATVLSEINHITQQAAENNNDADIQTAFSNIIKLQSLTQTEVIPMAVIALETTGDLSVIVTEFTGDELIDNVDEQSTGIFNGGMPVNDGDELTNKSINPDPDPDPEPTPPVTDTTKPTLTGSSPTDDATAVTVGGNVVLTFNETIKAGTGNIIISNGSDTRTIDVTDGTQVSISGSSVTINPSADLNNNSTYNIQLASGVITDTTGNAYAGINDSTTLNFSTLNTTPADTNAPTLSSSTPADDAATVVLDSNIVLNFNELVMAGTGNIVISDGTDTRTIDITDGTQVSFSGNTVTINPTADLNASTLYNVQLASDVITDTAGNAYAGINDTTTLNFSTLIAPIELSAVEQDGNDSGFVINGVSAIDLSGRSVSSAGDVNGDGLADLIVGAYGDDPNGSSSGASFVVFGKADGTAVELSNIETGTSGFVMNGVSASDYSGFSVSSAGDVNGDGFSDIIVGAVGDDPSGANSGASFVVFGGQGSSATVGTTGNDTLTGDGNANQLVAGADDDTLVGNGGADVLRGGAGDDILAVSDLTFASLDGGTGTDTLHFDAALDLDLRALSDTKLNSIEVINLTGDGGNSTLSLNLTDVLNLNEAQTAANTLVINGNAGDTVNLDDSSNGQTGTWADAGGSVYEFTVGGIGIIGTVTIDAAMTVNII